MFDAKIQQIIDSVSEKVDDKLYERVLDLKDWMNSYMQSAGLVGFGRRIEDMSKQMKIAVGISLGLSVADTILLFAILVKLGR